MKASQGVAVVGIACRFPDADSPTEFFANLQAGHCSIRRLSEQDLMAAGVDPVLWHEPNYKPYTAPVSLPMDFDHDYFGFYDKEAMLLDPQQRMLLELAVHAMEDAGVQKGEHELSLGIYGALSASGYFLRHLLPRADQQDFSLDEAYWGNRSGLSMSRIAYHLGSIGPAVLIDTACSSSLVAVHHAVSAIRHGECELALAGGVSLAVPMNVGYWYQQDGIMSADGQCRSFDAHATGSVRGSGGGWVVLKSLQQAEQDGDKIYGVVAGTAINNDGRQRIGFTAPGIVGQSRSLVKALQDAALSFYDLAYIEAHGSATKLGDEVELKALNRVSEKFTHVSKPPTLVGSVKANIGHLDAAAGIAGFIKSILALHYREIPPAVNFTEPNHTLATLSETFAVNTDSVMLEGNSPQAIAVGSLGIGGTNAHVVVHSHRRTHAKHQPVADSGVALQQLTYWFPLSAHDHTTLVNRARQLLSFLGQHKGLSLEKLSFTLLDKQHHYEHRALLLAGSLAELVTEITAMINSNAHSGERIDSLPVQLMSHRDNIQVPASLSAWLSGGRVTYKMVYGGGEPEGWYRLPAYPFNRCRLWVESLNSQPQMEESLSRTVAADDGQPATAIKEVLTAIWLKAFGFNAIDDDDNFFAIGGNSLLATQILSHIQSQLQVTVTLQRFFDNPTIADLTALLEQEKQTGKTALTTRVGRHELPLSPMQLELWYQHQLAPDNSNYNLVAAEKVNGRLDIACLYKAIEQTLTQYPILRSRFMVKANQVVQIAATKARDAISYIDKRCEWLGLSERQIEQRIAQLVDQWGNKPFDLSVGPPFEVAIVHVKSNEYLIVIRQHRIVSDAQTLGTLFKQIVGFYQALSAVDTDSADKGVDNEVAQDKGYFDYCELINEALVDRHLRSPLAMQLQKEKIYWQSVLQAISVTRLPTSVEPRVSLPDASHTLRFALPQPLVDLVLAFCSDQQLTLFNFLLATFNWTLHHYSGQRDILVMTPALNRQQPDFFTTPGHFMNRVALRNDVDKEQSLAELLQATQAVTTAALHHQAYPFEALVDALKLTSRYRHEPLFQTVFMMQDTEQDEALESPGLVFRPVPVPTFHNRYDFIAALRLERGKIHGRLDAKTALVDNESLSRFKHCWLQTIDLVLSSRERLAQQTLATLLHALPAATLAVPETGSGAASSEQPLNHSPLVATILQECWSLALQAPLPDVPQIIQENPDFWQLGGTLESLVVMWSLLQSHYPNACFKALAPQSDFNGQLNYLSDLEQDRSADSAEQDLEDNEQARLSLATVPLSTFQQRLWFLQHYQPGVATYHLPAAILVTGPLQVSRLKAAVIAAASQHYLLQADIEIKNDVPYWYFLPDVAYDALFETRDLRNLDPAEQDPAINLLVEHIVHQPFEFQQGMPLWRGMAVKIADEETLLLLCFHHLIADQSSGGLLIQGILEHYGENDTAVQPRPSAKTFFNVVHGHKQWLRTQQADRCRQFWKTYLKDTPDLKFPALNADPVWSAQQYEYVLPDELSTRIRRLCRENGVAPNRFFFAMLAILVLRQTGQTCFNIGMPVSLRDEHTAKLFAPLLNTVPVNLRILPFLSFKDFLRYTSDRVTQALDYQQLPLEAIIDVLDAPRSPDMPPLFQVMYSYLDSPQSTDSFHPLNMEVVPVTVETTDFPLTLEVINQNNGFLLQLACSNHHFNAQTQRALLTNLRSLVEELTASVTMPVQLNPLISTMSKVPQVADNATPAVESLHLTVNLFLNQVNKTPHKIAKTTQQNNLNYGELQACAAGIKSLLIYNGVARGDCVALYLQSRNQLPEIILAVLSLGAHFVPIDVRWPPGRVRAVVQKVKPQIVISDQNDLELWRELADQMIGLEQVAHAAVRPGLHALSNDAEPQDVAYILFTSGSTGEPKGVVISQEALAFYLNRIPAPIRPKEHDRVLALTALSFDISLTELLLPLTTGAAMVIFNEAINPVALVETLQVQRISYLQTTPSIWSLLLSQEWQPVVTEFTALSGGERLPVAIAQAILDRKIQLYNVYGPTEATIWCTFKAITQDLLDSSQQFVTNVGSLFPGCEAVVVSEELQPLASGGVGELWIAGKGLAAGYFNNRNLSQRFFLDDCFGADDGIRFYRTGDRVQCINQEYYYLERIDEQIKVNGQRFEPGEVTALLLRQKDIDHAYTWVESGDHGEVLACFVGSRHWTAEQVRQYLSQHIPAAAMPSRLVILPEVPLTDNGKLDIAQLRQLANKVATDTSALSNQANINSLVASITKTMEEVLDINQMLPDTSFFDQGGNSLLAIKVINLLATSANIHIPVRVLFECPVPYQLAHFLAGLLGEPEVPEEELEEGEI